MTYKKTDRKLKTEDTGFFHDLFRACFGRDAIHLRITKDIFFNYIMATDDHKYVRVYLSDYRVISNVKNGVITRHNDYQTQLVFIQHEYLQ
jgi:hypothetical protein